MHPSVPTPSSPGVRRHARWAGYALGFGFSGFFDGILLHQILQWHHLLSGLESGRFSDLRVQVMADGVFHLLMYVIGAAGLVLAWRARGVLGEPGRGRRLVADFLIGFGVWHVVDALLSHWLTGIHRIRMDVPDPLFWDLLWLGLFGVLPLMAAWWVGRGGGTGTRPATAIAALMVGATLTAAGLSLRPIPGADPDLAVVVLRPDARAAQWLDALEGGRTRVLWSDPAGGVWIVKADPDTDRLAWYARGAMYVSGSVLPATCAEWIRGDGAPGSTI